MNNQCKGNRLFPIFLKLDRLDILIVGGGNVGLEKLEALLKNDPQADVTLIGTSVKKEIKVLAREHNTIKLKERNFSPGDLLDRDLLILATNSRFVNEEICKYAKARSILCNVADTPDLCDFYLGSTVKKGDLKIGISTNGRSPTFAKRFREVLEDILPDDTHDLLQNLKAIRAHLKGNFAAKVKALNELTKELVNH